MLEKEPKQGRKFQYLRIYNLEKIWSRIHQVFGPEFTWSRKYLVPNSPLGPEFTWSRIHLVGCSGENLFVDQSNFFLDDYTDRQPSSRNTHQEYSFHLYSGGTSPPK